jgi:hypothetical protein
LGGRGPPWIANVLASRRSAASAAYRVNLELFRLASGSEAKITRDVIWATAAALDSAEKMVSREKLGAALASYELIREKQSFESGHKVEKRAFKILIDSCSYMGRRGVFRAGTAREQSSPTPKNLASGATNCRIPS